MHVAEFLIAVEATYRIIIVSVMLVVVVSDTEPVLLLMTKYTFDYKQPRDLLMDEFSQPFPPTALWRRHAQRLEITLPVIK
jgi:hypothetical protein